VTQSRDVEARIHAEADAQAAAPDDDALARFPYTRQALDETLRLYPPGWLLTRRSIARSRINDLDLPAGTDVLVSPYLVHRHPRYWRDGKEALSQ